jgi:RHS repeat-associated protein
VPFTIVPFWNARGNAPVGVYHTGEQQRCGVPHIFPAGYDTACVALRWPFNWSSADRGGGLPNDYWHGSLLGGKQDGSGFRYMRSRYYDPLTGRFTQEDPLGLGGGLNVYGFAGGDPINFSDPFGLTPCSEADYQDHWDYHEGTGPATVKDYPPRKQWHDCASERKAHEVEEIGRAAERKCWEAAGMAVVTGLGDLLALTGLHGSGKLLQKGLGFGRRSFVRYGDRGLTAAADRSYAKASSLLAESQSQLHGAAMGYEAHAIGVAGAVEHSDNVLSYLPLADLGVALHHEWKVCFNPE